MLLLPVGALDETLATAIRKALACDPLNCAIHGASFSWDRATDQFMAALGEASRCAGAMGDGAVQLGDEMEPA